MTRLLESVISSFNGSSGCGNNNIMRVSTLGLAVWMALRVQGLTSSMPCGRRRPASAVAAKKRKGRLVNELASSKRPKKAPPALVPVPGISAPKNNAVKGWVLGPPESPVRLAAVQSDGKLYVMEGRCSRCSWEELDKGAIHNKDSLCCPLCGQTYNLATGKPGEVVERAGFGKWLGDLARGAPTSRPAKQARTVRAALDGDTVLLDIEGSFLATAFAAPPAGSTAPS